MNNQLVINIDHDTFIDKYTPLLLIFDSSLSVPNNTWFLKRILRSNAGETLRAIWNSGAVCASPFCDSDVRGLASEGLSFESRLVHPWFFLGSPPSCRDFSSARLSLLSAGISRVRELEEATFPAHM